MVVGSPYLGGGGGAGRPRSTRRERRPGAAARRPRSPAAARCAPRCRRRARARSGTRWRGRGPVPMRATATGRARTSAAARPGPCRGPGRARTARARRPSLRSSHLEPPAVRHGLEPVAREVPEHLRDLVGVGEADVRPLVGVEGDLVAGPHLGAVAQEGDRLLDEGPQVHRLRGPAARDASLEEEAVERVREPLRLARDDVEQALLLVAEMPARPSAPGPSRGSSRAGCGSRGRAGPPSPPPPPASPSCAPPARAAGSR